jgi:hypothetical protein
MNKSDSRKRIVYILETPPSKRDYDRYGINYSKASGNITEIWEISQIIFSKHHKNLDVGVGSSKAIKSIIQFRKHILELQDNDVLIFIGCIFNPVNFQHLFTLLQLRRIKCKTSAVYTTVLPATSEKASQKFNIIQVIQKLKNYKQYMLVFVFKILKNNRIKFQNILNLKSLDFIWTSRDFEDIPSLFLNCDTVIRAIHAFDYDEILQEIENDITHNNKYVLLDSMGPAHPDYKLGSYRNIPSIEMWKEKVCKALDNFEIEIQSQVIIAAHPRAEKQILDYLYAGREIISNQTCRLVRGAKAVIIPEGSTAISFAVFFEKPIYFFDSEIFDPNVRKLVKNMSRLLDMPVLNIDSEFYLNSIAEVDKAKYFSYVNMYLKQETTKKDFFWHIVFKDLQLTM